MDDHTPIACTLTAAQLPDRLAEMAAVGRDSLTTVDRDQAGRPTLHFRGDEATRSRLAAIVAAESECCAFLAFALEQRFDSLALTITGPELAAPLVDDLIHAFSASGTA